MGAVRGCKGLKYKTADKTAKSEVQAEVERPQRHLPNDKPGSDPHQSRLVGVEEVSDMAHSPLLFIV